MAAAKRRFLAEERKAPPQRKRPQRPNGASLPPIPRAASSDQRQQASPSAAAASVVAANPIPSLVPPGAGGPDLAALERLRRGSGMPEAHTPRSSTGAAQQVDRPAHHRPAPTNISPEVTACADDCQQQPIASRLQSPSAVSITQSSPVPIVAVPPTKAVPTIAAPPSAKSSAVRQAHSQDTKNSRVMPELTKSQIERLDSSHWTEWQFEFGTPVNSNLQGNGTPGSISGKQPSCAGSRRSSPASRGCPVSHRSMGSQLHNSRPGSQLANSRPASRSAMHMGSQGCSSARSSSSGGSSASSRTSHSASPERSPLDSIPAADFAAAPTTASGTPAGINAVDAKTLVAGKDVGRVEGASDNAVQHLSLAELNSKLSSMQMATSALL